MIKQNLQQVPSVSSFQKQQQQQQQQQRTSSNGGGSCCCCSTDNHNNDHDDDSLRIKQSILESILLSVSSVSSLQQEQSISYSSLTSTASPQLTVPSSSSSFLHYRLIYQQLKHFIHLYNSNNNAMATNITDDNDNDNDDNRDDDTRTIFLLSKYLCNVSTMFYNTCNTISNTTNTTTNNNNNSINNSKSNNNKSSNKAIRIQLCNLATSILLMNDSNTNTPPTTIAAKTTNITEPSDITTNNTTITTSSSSSNSNSTPSLTSIVTLSLIVLSFAIHKNNIDNINYDDYTCCNMDRSNSTTNTTGTTTTNNNNKNNVTRSIVSAILSVLDNTIQKESSKNNNDILSMQYYHDYPDTFSVSSFIQQCIIKLLSMNGNNKSNNSIPSATVQNINNNIDFYILTRLARSLQIYNDCWCYNNSTYPTCTSNHTNHTEFCNAITSTILNALPQLELIDENDTNNIVTDTMIQSEKKDQDDGDDDDNNNNNDTRITTIIPFAIQVQPWGTINPVQLIKFVMEYDLWYMAEQICVSCCTKNIIGKHENNDNSNNKRNSTMISNVDNNHISTTTCDQEATTTAVVPRQQQRQNQISIDAVCTLIDIAMQRRAYRQADQIATKFFDTLSSVWYDDDDKNQNKNDIDNDQNNPTKHRIMLLEQYYLNARYLHACSTIVKLIRKGVIPVIERQVERIDQVVVKINDHYINRLSKPRQNIISNDDEDNNDDVPFYEGGTTLKSAKMDIRNFALQQLIEGNNDMETIQRLISIWDMEKDTTATAMLILLDPKNIEIAKMKYKEKYLQWEDLFIQNSNNIMNNYHGIVPPIPELISTSEELRIAMNDLVLGTMNMMNRIKINNNNDTTKNDSTISRIVYGFDVEWGGYDDIVGVDDNNNNGKKVISTGAALLQIATIYNVVLIDVPALSSTLDGVIALEQFVSPLFYKNDYDMDGSIMSNCVSNDSNTEKNIVFTSSIMVGFSCREDISKLRLSPCIRKERHWFQCDNDIIMKKKNIGSSDSRVMVYDLQSLIGQLNIKELSPSSSSRNQFGLSRCCEYYIKKPLDKSEQCSEWNRRPLTLKQRIYASLDAYVCAYIYTNHFLN